MPYADPEKRRSRQREHYRENKVQYNERSRKYRNEHREEIQAKGRERYQQIKKKHIAECTARNKARRAIDPLYRASLNLRRRIQYAFAGKDRSLHTREIIGCSPEQLRSYLEKRFQDGMTWENYGYRGWHIDHIVPLSSSKNSEDLIRLSHYTNLQPLWSHENFKKRAQVPEGLSAPQPEVCVSRR